MGTVILSCLVRREVNPVHVMSDLALLIQVRIPAGGPVAEVL